MSETDHIRGILKLVYLPTGVATVKELLKLKLEEVGRPYEENSGYTLEEYFIEEFYGAYFLIKGDLWEVESREESDPYDAIFKARELDDETIEFEVKYYNGGCSEIEAIKYALESLSK